MALAGAAPGRSLDPPDPLLVGEEFASLVGICELHRLLGALANAVEGAQWPLTPAQFDLLEERVLVWLRTGLCLERVALGLSDVLTRAGIEHVLLKGIALAHSLYADPAERVFADLDVLVLPGDALDRAILLAESGLGAVRVLPDLRPGFASEFGKDVTLRIPGPDRLEVDLHRTLVAGPLGMPG